MQNRKDELDQFKSEINLGEYACAMFGFVYDRKASSRSSAVVRHANGDKLIITRRPNQHFVYFNAKGEDAGTILDFIQARKAISLGKIRQELRAWTAVDMRMPLTGQAIVLEPSQHDASRVLKAWANGDPIASGNRYLIEERKIPSSVFLNPVFEDQIQVDSRSNVLFAHRNSDGELTGYEIKNRSFTGFSPGGCKGLFQSTPNPNASLVVVAESAIDMLSAAALFGVEEKCFLSTSGQVSPGQVEQIVSLLRGMPSLNEVWLAFDNDDAGRNMAAKLTATLTSDIPCLKVVAKLPPIVDADWNDILKSGGIQSQVPAPRK